jgi:outer membrane protein assembly factor BamE (lipoprotein component of BamABCDE complex)
MLKRVYIIPLMIVVALVTVAAFLKTGGAGMAQGFSRDVWTSENRIYDEDYPRLQMIDDVLARLARGMSRADVEVLLGEPTDTPYFRQHDLVYWLGQQSGKLMVDSSWLVIDFDEGGLVSARMVTD